MRAVTVRFVGAPGAIGVHGVEGSDGSDGKPMPIAFCARTRKICATPSASGLTVRATFLHTQPTTPVFPLQVVHETPLLTEYSIM